MLFSIGLLRELVMTFLRSVILHPKKTEDPADVRAAVSCMEPGRNSAPLS